MTSICSLLGWCTRDTYCRGITDAYEGGLYIMRVLLKKMRDEGGGKTLGIKPDTKVAVSRTSHAIVMDDMEDGDLVLWAQ